MTDHAQSATHTSCAAGTPLVKLGEGNASTLNYQLPQSSSFSAKGYLLLDIPRTYWEPSLFEKPSLSFYNTVASLNDQGLENTVVGAEQAFGRDAFRNRVVQRLTRYESTDAQARKGKWDRGDAQPSKDDRGGDDVPIGKDDREQTATDVIPLIQAGLQPVCHTNLYGEMEMNFVPEPIEPTPELAICFHFKVASYLGDYGAGKTVKTFSLLPGEKSEITIQTYRHLESTRKKSETVLDSFTQESSAELENLVEEESSFISETTNSSTSTQQDSKYKDWSVGGGVDIPLKVASVNVSGGVGGGNSSFSSDEKSSSGHISDMNKVLETAMDRQVETSTAVRDISVNSESSETFKEGEETSTVRVLENMNFSRVLNFVFRQLVQEYITLTYLDRVSFVYHNGYPDAKRVADLSDLPILLADLIPDENHRKEVLNGIITQICRVYDWEGTPHQFIEKAEESIGGCLEDAGEMANVSYWRKKAGLSQTYAAITVPGIIVGTKHRILPTDSVVTEALLGQGEALDCYNQKLQAAAVEKAELENRLTEMEIMMKEQAHSILNSIEDPTVRAELFKKVWGDCCDVPQNQIIS